MKFAGLPMQRGLMRESLAILAFVAIFARALIPVGFMPALVHGQPQLILCDGHHASHGHAGVSEDSPCPFAMSGGAAPLPTLPAWPISIAEHEFQRADDAHTIAAASPHRHTAPRGPPSPPVD